MPAIDTADAEQAIPKENLFREVYPGLEVRDGSDGTSMPTMVGHFSVFNQWTEINSAYEGRFLERIAPGAFTKTLKENRDNIRVLFQHGRDPQIGDKPLGPIRNVQEDETGASYEVPLLDTSYNRDIIPGLQAGLYGASFRFSVVKEDVVRQPKRSAYNPDSLPERTITEARVMEFGPVTFPAYGGATAGVRSITDRFVTVQREERADTESVSVLAQMYALGQDFIEGEVDPEDAADRDAMAAILEQIEALIEVEAAEDPASEDSPATGGRSLDGAGDSHSDSEDHNPAEALDDTGAGGSHSNQSSRVSPPPFLPSRGTSGYQLDQKEQKPKWQL